MVEVQKGKTNPDGVACRTIGAALCQTRSEYRILVDDLLDGSEESRLVEDPRGVTLVLRRYDDAIVNSQLRACMEECF